MSDDAEDRVNELYESVEKGEPILRYVIEPPFDVSIESNMVHVDAPCLAMWGNDKAAVMRLSFTADAAKALAEFLGKLEFSDSGKKTHRLN